MCCVACFVFLLLLCLEQALILCLFVCFLCLADYRHSRFQGWKRTHDHYMESGRHQCLCDRNVQQLEAESTAQQKASPLTYPTIFFSLVQSCYTSKGCLNNRLALSFTLFSNQIQLLLSRCLSRWMFWLILLYDYIARVTFRQY